MPEYSYECENGHAFDRWLPLSEYKSAQKCECGAPAKKIFTTPVIIASKEIHYESPIDGRPIESMKQRQQDLARSNCQEYDPEMKTDYIRRQQKKDASLEKAVSETVEKELAKMPSEKLERLQNELVGGVDIEPVRQTAPEKPIKTRVHHG